MPRILCALLLLFAACGGTPSPLQRTLAEGTARYELTVARGPSAVRSSGVLDFDAATAPIDLDEWVEGSRVDTDHRGRIVRVEFHERDVAVTLRLSDFGAPVPSGPRGREDGGHLRGGGGALALPPAQGLR